MILVVAAMRDAHQVRLMIHYRCEILAAEDQRRLQPINRINVQQEEEEHGRNDSLRKSV
jgi:hypothetical protein